MVRAAATYPPAAHHRPSISFYQVLATPERAGWGGGRESDVGRGDTVPDIATKAGRAEQDHVDVLMIDDERGHIVW